MKKKIIFFLIFILLIFFDQITKQFFFDTAHHTLNNGVSFGLFAGFGQQEVLQLGVLAVLAVVLYSIQIPMFIKVLFLAGVIGNTIDRFAYSGVRDWFPIPFLSLHNNLADWYIFGAICIFVLQYWYEFRHTLRRR